MTHATSTSTLRADGYAQTCLGRGEAVYLSGLNLSTLPTVRALRAAGAGVDAVPHATMSYGAGLRLDVTSPPEATDLPLETPSVEEPRRLTAAQGRALDDAAMDEDSPVHCFDFGRPRGRRPKWASVTVAGTFAAAFEAVEALAVEHGLAVLTVEPRALDYYGTSQAWRFRVA